MKHKFKYRNIVETEEHLLSIGDYWGCGVCPSNTWCIEGCAQKICVCRTHSYLIATATYKYNQVLTPKNMWIKWVTRTNMTTQNVNDRDTRKRSKNNSNNVHVDKVQNNILLNQSFMERWYTKFLNKISLNQRISRLKYFLIFLFTVFYFIFAKESGEPTLSHQLFVLCGGGGRERNVQKHFQVHT